MTIPPLSLSDIVNISVTVAPTAASANPFNQGLFIGNSTAIPSYGANSRLRQYAASTFSTAMLTDGFTSNSPELIAMQIYFSQTPQPAFGWVGRQDTTAIQTAAVDVGGTGWNVGDQFTIAQGGASNALCQVVTVSSGAVATFAFVTRGTGFSTAVGLTATAVSPSTGTGLIITVTAIGETLLQAAQACRAANSTWYGLAVYNPVDADNLALAEWADPLWQSTRYYAWSADTAIANGTVNNLALQLQTLKLRTVGIYSTTQSGLYPNNIYAAAGLMGVDMGFNTGLAASFFTLAHKQIVGIAVEPITETQYTNIKAASFNVYGNFAPYQFFEPGVLSNGAQSFLWLYLAVLVANLQINELNVLEAFPAVPQTNAGQQLLLQAADSACALMVTIGFIAGGVWEGRTVLNLSNGQALPSGYVNQSQPYALQSAADRAAGKAMPIYCSIITAGAVQSLTIAVYTQL